MFCRYNGQHRQSNGILDFTVVILNEHTSAYPTIKWTDWKDDNRKRMISQGDHWSQATLTGTDIWNCLEINNIDPVHLVQWKPASDRLHRVSLPLDHETIATQQ